MKATFHKSCSCKTCRRGRGGNWGQFIHRHNERKLRHDAKQKLADVVRGKEEDAFITPIASPYTD